MAAHGGAPFQTPLMGPVSPLCVWSLPLVIWARDEARWRTMNSVPTAYGTGKCGTAWLRQPGSARTRCVRLPPFGNKGRARRRRPSQLYCPGGSAGSWQHPAQAPRTRLTFFPFLPVADGQPRQVNRRFCFSGCFQFEYAYKSLYNTKLTGTCICQTDSLDACPLSPFPARQVIL